MSIDPESVPAAPVYTITLGPQGAAIDGTPVPGTTGEDPAAARQAALREVYVKAAFHGRPVRVTAKETAATWSMIVTPGGDVLTLSTPHPYPEPRPAPDWSGDLPAAYGPALAAVRAAEAADRIPEAAALAETLAKQAEADHGPLHPHTVSILTLRAWLTLRADGAWAAEALIETAQRRIAAHAPPDETARLTHNAHATWRMIAREDPDYARDLTARLLGILTGDDRRTADVLRLSPDAGA
ncbi:hypothetical protein AB0918_18760 [Streptomyces sp. NPDC006864]|uniref:hypothetical protein n=1 Tax=Streptomyces sp. NPDC006864 TaxID=3154780 RepID=UPI0034553AA0